MSDARFDAFLASLARARSRRGVLAVLAAAVGSAALADGAGAADVVAQACRGRKAKCKRKRECCSERCRTGKRGKRRKCACSAEGKRCLETSDCCKGDVRLTCVSGFCVRDRR